MAETRNTTANVLRSLNGTDEVTGRAKALPWEIISTPYVLPVVTITGMDRFNIEKFGMVVRAFINRDTNEIKTFAAKWLDTPEASQLP